MPLALPLRLHLLLHVLRFQMPRGPKRASGPRLPSKRRLDLCALSRHERRDLGFENFDCEIRRDWRSFR